MDNRLQPPPCSVQTSNKASGSVYPQDGTEAENYQNYHIINYQIITIIKLPIVNYQNKMSNVGNGSVREAPLKKTQGLFGHCPNRGAVSTLARMVWGTYFEKNCPCSKGHLLGLGG